MSRARNADELLASNEPSSELAESSSSSQASSLNTLSGEVLKSSSLPSSSMPEGCFLYSDKDMKQKLKGLVSVESLKQVGWEVKTDGYEFSGQPPFLVVGQTIYLDVKQFLSGFQKTNTYTVTVSDTPSSKAGVANIYTIQDNRGIKYYLDSISYATKTTPSNSVSRIKCATCQRQ